MIEHLDQLQDHHNTLLDLLDDPAIDPGTWEMSSYFELAFMRALPDQAFIVAFDEADVARFRARLAMIRGRPFTRGCSVVTISDYLLHRDQVGRPTRAIMSPGAMSGLLNYHRTNLAAVALNGTRTLRSIRTSLLGEKEGRDPEGAAP